MTDSNIREIEQPSAKPDQATKSPEKKEDWRSFTWFCIKLVLVVLIFRSFVFMSFNIPSESMMPRLLVGDFLFAKKWSYGFSKRSLPFDGFNLVPEGRIFASQPEAGDVVIFEHPVDGTDYIKRVIGLPGDEVQVISGVVHLNGQPVGYERIEDFVVPIEADDSCGYGLASFTQEQPDGTFACVYPQFQETLPNGVTYNVLDFGPRVQDDTPPVIVPAGHMFLMGDNRDNSMDSRFPARPGEGVGLVPQENLVAEAGFMYWSWGDAEGVRWSRIGRGI